ncbi:MAG: DUF4351 domain-containing protein [Caldilineaceae bacterium]|nr:DUF4351 domain-containing protein [Caldilineaceae bacterium]
MQYITGIERRALDKGREEGREEGRRDTAVRLLLRLLNHRFAQLPADLPARFQHLNADQIEALMDTALTTASFAEFAQHIPVKSNNSEQP